MAARTLPGVTYTAAMPLKVRLQVTGTAPTTIRVKVWPASGTEPTSWFETTTDTTALQSTGTIALTSYLSSSATNAPLIARFTNLTAQHTAAPPPTNQPPTAVFASLCTDVSCTFDSTGSTDPDGTVASYAWSFGDGTTSTAAAPTHAFTAAGAYQVKLTVTDDGGATELGEDGWREWRSTPTEVLHPVGVVLAARHTEANPTPRSTASRAMMLAQWPGLLSHPLTTAVSGRVAGGDVLGAGVAVAGGVHAVHEGAAVEGVVREVPPAAHVQGVVAGGLSRAGR